MTRTVKKPDVRRAEIIQAATTLFAAQDYEGTTMQDVMEALGIAKGTIYHYFKSKEELLEAVVLDLVAESAARMQAVVDASTGNALEKLRLLVQAGNQADEHPEILDQLHRPGNAGMHARLLGRAVLIQAPLYAELFRQGTEEGLFLTDTPLETAEFVLCAAHYLTDTSIYPWTPEDLERRAQALPALFEAQLKAQPGAFQFLTQQIHIQKEQE